jgi:predicted nucleotide-binding protein
MAANLQNVNFLLNKVSNADYHTFSSVLSQLFSYLKEEIKDNPILNKYEQENQKWKSWIETVINKYRHAWRLPEKVDDAKSLSYAIYSEINDHIPSWGSQLIFYLFPQTSPQDSLSKFNDQFFDYFRKAIEEIMSASTNKDNMYYHIRLLKRPGIGELRLNLKEEELMNRYVEPYLVGETVVINGTTLDPKELYRVNITRTEGSLDGIVKKLEIENENKLPLERRNPKWEAFETAEDVTEHFINKPPGSNSKANQLQAKQSSNNKVFVVHGHDVELKNDVEIFLRNIQLEPIVLHRQLDEGLTVIEKFEKHSDVNYAIILLTPDDVGFSNIELKKPDEERKKEYRARQNVIFEFGFFVGRLSRKNVCCIYKEGVTVPSDLNGLIYKQVNKSVEEVGMFLMRELKNAGMPVKFE